MAWTLDDMLDALNALPPDLPASFAGPHGQTQGHWHVTRLTLARRSHVDCDGGQGADLETVLEVLDGPPGAPMEVDRLVKILSRCRSLQPETGAAPLQVFHRSMRFTVTGVEDGCVQLQPATALCRPLARMECCA